MTKHMTGGSIVRIGSTTRATTVTQYETDMGSNGVDVGEVEDLGSLGPTANSVTGTAVNNKLLEKFKGAIDNGTLALVCFTDNMDPGQKKLKQAMKDNFDHNFHATLNDAPTEDGTPTEYFFRGKVMSVTTALGTVDNLMRTTFNIGINSEILEVEPTTGAAGG